MIRSVALAAAGAAFVALAAPLPTQAHMANPGLSLQLTENSAAQVEPVHYRRYRHGHRYWRPHYAGPPRRCWTERVRVRTPGGYVVWRTYRHCGWRRW